MTGWGVTGWGVLSGSSSCNSESGDSSSQVKLHLREGSGVPCPKAPGWPIT